MLQTRIFSYVHPRMGEQPVTRSLVQLEDQINRFLAGLQDGTSTLAPGNIQVGPVTATQLHDGSTVFTRTVEYIK